MCNIHLEMTLVSGDNEPDVSIWSNGEFLEDEIMYLLNKCWT